MPVIHSLFGGSGRDDTFSFSSPHAWCALDGSSFNSSLFPGSRKDPGSEVPPLARARVKSETTTEHHIFKTDLHGIRAEDVKLKAEAGILQVRGEQRAPKGKGQIWRGGERCPSRLCHRIPLPEDAQVDQVQAAVRKGVLIITVPRKQMQKQA